MKRILTRHYSTPWGKKYPTNGVCDFENFKKLFQIAIGNVALPPTFYIAGTNGKGSCGTFLNSCLTASGLKVHWYTSPHMHHVCQRILLAGMPIERGYLAELLLYGAQLAERHQCALSLFQGLTLSGLLAFSQTAGDVIILEAGIGARLDPTNVIASPCVSILTPISLDHQEILGHSLMEIAREKSAIMRPKIPFVTGGQSQKVQSFLRSRAMQMRCPLWMENEKWRIGTSKDAVLSFCFFTSRRTKALKTDFLLGLAGDHQKINSALAIAALKAQKKFSITDAHISQGLERARWPGRLHLVPQVPCVPKKCSHQWWMDGAHNEGGAKALAAFVMNKWRRPIVFVISALRNRCPSLFLPHLLPVASCIHFITQWKNPNLVDQQVQTQQKWQEFLATTEITSPERKSPFCGHSNSIKKSTSTPNSQNFNPDNGPPGQFQNTNEKNSRAPLMPFFFHNTFSELCQQNLGPDPVMFTGSLYFMAEIFYHCKYDAYHCIV